MGESKFISARAYIHSSSRIRILIWIVSRLGPLQNLASHFAGYRGKAGRNFFERVIFFEIIEERLYRYTRSLEDWRSTKNFRIHRNEVIGFHGPNIIDMVTSGKRTPRRFDPRVAP